MQIQIPWITMLDRRSSVESACLNTIGLVRDATYVGRDLLSALRPVPPRRQFRMVVRDNAHGHTGYVICLHHVLDEGVKLLVNDGAIV